MTINAPTRSITTIAGIDVVADDTMPPGALAYRDADGRRLCAACLCPEDRHCRVCGCLTHKDQRDECLCAKFVEVIWACVECGHMFGKKWQMQVHTLPTPTCRTGARAAAGKHADNPNTLAPLLTHRDKYIRGAR